MYLLYQSRIHPDELCTAFLEEEEWKILMTVHSKSPIVNYKTPTIGQCIIWIARLGGYINRKNDDPPGIKSLWRGLQQLNIMLKVIHQKNQWFST